VIPKCDAKGFPFLLGFGSWCSFFVVSKIACRGHPWAAFESGEVRMGEAECARSVDMTSFSLKIFTNVFAPLFEGDTTWGPSSYWVLYLLSCEKMPKGLRSGVTVSEAHHIASLKTWFCCHGCGYLTVNVCQYLSCFNHFLKHRWFLRVSGVLGRLREVRALALCVRPALAWMLYCMLSCMCMHIHVIGKYFSISL